MSSKGLTLQALIFSLALLPGFAYADESDTAMGSENTFWEKWQDLVNQYVLLEDTGEPDPLESFNRKIFAFNDFADRYTLKPLAKGYQWVTPDPVEKGVSNVFSNLFEIRTILNDLLQLKFSQAASDSGRFLINSTFGLAGIFDLATDAGLEKNNEDFGQTLGYWGVGSGPYIVMPLLGSYTFRSGLGVLVDNNVDYVTHIDHVPTRNSTLALRMVNTRAGLFTAETLITGDRYTFIRDAYTQRREFLTNDGAIQEDDFGDDDEDFDDWEE